MQYKFERNQIGIFRLLSWNLGLGIWFLVLGSCSSPSPPSKAEKPNPAQFKEPLIKVNKYLVEKESDEIDQYISRRGWNMERTGTGLRYMFLQRGSGKPVQPGNRVRVHYKISLPDGTLCYSSEQGAPEEFIAEHDNVESGLHEAVLLLREGDKARFILPSYMAHGLRGDEDKIPPLSPVIVDLEVVQIHATE